MRTESVLIWLIALATSTAPQIDLTTPRGVVTEFCRLDANGARLSTAAYRKINPLVAWPEEPGWDTAVVIGGYETSKASFDGDGERATVVVSYEVLGVLSGERWYPLERIEPDSIFHRFIARQVTYTVEQNGNSWRLVGPVVHPHVDLIYMAAHARYFADKARYDRSPRPELEQAVAALDALIDARFER